MRVNTAKTANSCNKHDDNARMTIEMDRKGIQIFCNIGVWGGWEAGWGGVRIGVGYFSCGLEVSIHRDGMIRQDRYLMDLLFDFEVVA